MTGRSDFALSEDAAPEPGSATHEARADITPATRQYPWMAHPAGSLPHRIDWYRVLAVILIVASGLVAFAIASGLAWLALAVAG